MPDRKFDFFIQPYTEPTLVELQDNVNSVMIVNMAPVGGALATINQYPLNATLVAGAAGEALIIGGNEGEVLNRKTLDLGFPNGTANARVLIVQKYYPR